MPDRRANVMDSTSDLNTDHTTQKALADLRTKHAQEQSLKNSKA
jgi:hypothetical protein